LPYQPESTLVPQGGKFYDVFMAISLISENIPHDWKILVKEHPAQYIRTNNRYGYIGRDINFYERLKKIKKVILFNNSNYNHFFTIDKSQAVATINGTTGFEAIIRKKPCIIFGEVFYATAPNVYKINNSDDAKFLVKAINKMKFYDEQKMINFINGIIDSGQQIFFDEMHAKSYMEKFNYEENKNKLRKLITKYIK
jgi:capsule polysaccharide modification protein KpsS